MSKRRKKIRGNPAQPPQPRRGAAKAAHDEQSSPRILVYALLFIAAFMFSYLHLYAMPQLRHFADGLSMPGARLTGYEAEEIEGLRAVMEDSAAGQLNFLHTTAGNIFPLALLLATWAVMGLLVRGRWRWVLVASAGLFTIVDITKNVLINRILVQEPLNPDTVSAASSLTVISWVMLVAIGTALVAVVVWDLFTGRSRSQP